MSRIENRTTRRRPRGASPRTLLRDALDTSGYTRTEAAKRSGISRQHLYNLMDGKCAPGIETARRVAAVVGGEIAELFP